MKKNGLITAVMVGLLALASSSYAEEVSDLQRQLDEIKGKIQELQAQKKVEAATGSSDHLKSLLGSTKISGYGELDYIFTRSNRNGNGGNTLDPHRVVLNVYSELADWIDFNSELEWENGGSDGGAEGGISVEQAYLTFKINPSLKINSGVMLLPMGAINQNHEPTNFYSSARPALDTYLIPSTWQAMGLGISGVVADRVDYQLMAVTGLDGSKFDAENGVREGRQDFGKVSNNSFGVTGRLDVRPLQNLRTSLSLYTGNSAPSGSPSAYTTIAAVDGRYRFSDFELAGEYVHVYQDRPEILNTEIGRNMSGYWVEGDWHAMPKAWKQGKLGNADAVLFARYSELNTQNGGAIDPGRTSGRFNRNYTTFGISFMPVPSVAIKADYQIYGDHSAAGETPIGNDKFQVTIGFVF
ncbi:MAG: porin [Geobacteraceae bacterium]|nr:porin [Geobacteraceae bacterium]